VFEQIEQQQQQPFSKAKASREKKPISIFVLRTHTRSRGDTFNLTPDTYHAMFRLTRPLFQALKKSTGITGLSIHSDPLPELIKTYKQTISVLSTIPRTSVYRQGAEAFSRHKLNMVQAANGNITVAELRLKEGLIEESLEIASDELELARKMVEWKACVPFPTLVFISIQKFLTCFLSLQLGGTYRKIRARPVGAHWKMRQFFVKEFANCSLCRLHLLGDLKQFGGKY